MQEVLAVEKRETRGKRQSQRLRAAGSIPAVLYGHGEATVSLSVPADRFDAVLRHGARVVDLTGAVSETAFIRDLQWDVFGNEVLHVDFTRVSADERLQVEVEVRLRGEAPGVKEGGHLEHVVHAVEIDCLATAIPDHLDLRVSELHLNASLTAADIELPDGVKLVTEPETTIVNCAPAVEVEEEVAVGEEGEPEVIGGHKEEGEEGESS